MHSFLTEEKLLRIKQLPKIRQSVILCGHHSWDNEPQIANKATRISSAVFYHIFWYSINFESGSILDIYIPGSQSLALRLLPWKPAWSILSLWITRTITEMTVTLSHKLQIFRKCHCIEKSTTKFNTIGDTFNSERLNYMLRQHLIVWYSPPTLSSPFLAHTLQIWEWLQSRGASED